MCKNEPYQRKRGYRRFAVERKLVYYIYTAIKDKKTKKIVEKDDEYLRHFSYLGESLRELIKIDITLYVSQPI